MASTLTQSIIPKGTKSVTSRAGTTYSSASSKYPRRASGSSTYKPRGIFTKPASIHAIDIDLTDPLASLIVPDNMSELDETLCDRYCAVLGAMQTSPNTFDINSPCKVCNISGHIFKHCKVLQKNELLRAHFIGVKLKDDHLKKLIERHSKAVHSIDATSTEAETSFHPQDFRLDEK